MDWRPLIAIVLKSFSIMALRKRGLGLSITFITSASPLGLEVKYAILEPGVPCVKSYSRSRVMPVAAKRFI